MHQWLSGIVSQRGASTPPGAEGSDACIYPNCPPQGHLKAELYGQLELDELREYAPEIGILASAGAAEQRFLRYRATRLLIVGTGPLLAALLRGALQTGCRDVRVMGSESDTAEGLAELVSTSRRDCRQQVRLQPAHEAITFTDTVLQVSDSADELIATADLCASARASLGQVLLNGDEMWIGPVGPADRTTITSAWRRLHGDITASATVADDDAAPELSARQLLRAWFRCATGIFETSHLPFMVRTDLRSLATTRHRFAPMSSGRVASMTSPAEARAAFLLRQSGAAVETGELLERAAIVMDPRTGLCAEAGEERVEVGPSFRWECRMAVADPARPRSRRTPGITVAGHSSDRRTARLVALLAALAAYGALAARESLRGLSCDSDQEIWGLDLVTGGLRRIPARQVYSTSGFAPSRRPPVGAAAGLTWVHALENALAQHCEALLARQLGEPGTVVSRLADPGREGDLPAALLHPLHAVGDPVAHDLTALLSVPACAVRLGSRTVLAVAPTAAGAVRTAVERALCAGNAEAWVVPAILPHQEQPPPLLPTAAAAPGRARFVAALRARGLTPVAVLLDHDPEAVAVLPYMVQVTLVSE